MDFQRRRVLTVAGGTLAGLAGCTSERDTDTPDGGEDTTDTPTPTAPGDAPPGADQLGGPDDLQSSATVEALSLDADQGAGSFVFSPAVVWVEPGATVTWRIASGSHSATAYHPDNDRSRRVPGAAAAFDSGVLDEGERFEHTLETEGVHNYHCTPHEGLGMVGLVIVGGVGDGPGAAPPDDVDNGTAAERLGRLLSLAGIETEDVGTTYGWQDSTWDAYWYSLYNMSTNIAMSANGVTFPATDDQQAAFEQRFPAMLNAAGEDQPPVKNPNLNMLPFTEGDPAFTEQPVLSGDDGRPDASTLAWDRSASSGVVSPSSLAWTHLKGVTWAKNFENHFDVLPEDLAAEFRSMVLSTLAQLGVRAGLVAGGPAGDGLLTKGESLELVSGVAPARGEVVDATARPTHHAAMLWFLSDLASLADGGWFGYENPEPLMPADAVQQLADGMAGTTMALFSPADVVAAGSTRDLGLMLGAVGWYGTHAGSDQLRADAAAFADALAAEVEAHLADDGRVRDGAANQAATQGLVGQGLLWASQVDGVDHANVAERVLGYLVDPLWDDDAGTFASAVDADTYTITARDAGDITGGLNAAEAVLGMDVRQQFARFFDGTFNRGRLQRAERPPSRDESAAHTLPLPPAAGGDHGQAAVYNAVVEYDTGADAWSVTDRLFDTEAALYLANQDIWVGQWAGDFYHGRGVPGTNDAPE